MQFPQRIDAHISETESWRLLQERAPRNWIIRDFSERDYGIDAHIEIASHDGHMTGNMFFAQLKAKIEGISWRGTPPDIIASSPPIATSTVNYWMGSPMPVLLLCADLKEREVYVAFAKQQARRKYGKLRTQQSMTFDLNRLLFIRREPENPWLNPFIQMERKHGRFVSELQSLITNMDVYRSFILDNIGRDAHMEVEPDVIAQMFAFYGVCRFLAGYLLIDWPLKPLDAYFEEDRAAFNDGLQLHEWGLTEILRGLSRVFYLIVLQGLRTVSEWEADYWAAISPSIHLIANTEKYQMALRQTPEEFYGRPRHLMAWPDFD